MSVERAATIVATFDTAAEADRAIAEAITLGLAPAHVGRLEDGHGPVLVSVAPAPNERTATLEVMGRLAVGPLLDFADARAVHRRLPHPGVDDRGGVKLPFAVEFPRVSTPPAPPRAPHAVLDVSTRTLGFAEIDGGLTMSNALIEADRCVRCPEPPCQTACPAGNDIPRFIDRIAQHDLAGAFAILRRTNSFSAICGRVCDVDLQCEGSCVLRAAGGQAVQIGRLERLVADTARAQAVQATQRAEREAPKVAIIGAGPAGLAAASDLVEAGYEVEVIDESAEAGGAVSWGIPEFRLPRVVLQREIEELRARGVIFTFGRKLGRDFELEETAASRAAVVLAIGTQGSVTMPLPGGDLKGVWQAKQLLTTVKLGGTERMPHVGPRSIVLGGGNTALDAAQTLTRLRRNGSAPEVTIVYRRGEEEMPARRDEVNSARAEGVTVRSWATPIAILGTDDGRVRGVRFVRTRAVRPADGRRSQIAPVPGSDFELPADTVVYALGYQTVLPNLTGVSVDKKGLIAADVARGRTSRANVWAVGDVVTGPKTVVHAMAAGRRVARDIARSLRRNA